ncbi:hypothetical protein ZWY2020_023507 [Hordeum vulgare]|nr:hypothetical protein ZWY2020_023507 [Hordeum vulgare]
MACVINMHPQHKFYDRFFRFASTVTNAYPHSKFFDLTATRCFFTLRR